MRFEWYPIRLLFRQRVVRMSLALSALTNLVAWVVLWLVPRPVDGGQVFLHYTVIFGIDKIGKYGELFAAPLWGAVILLINMVIAWLIFPKAPAMAEFLVLATVFVEIGTLLAAVLLYLTNT